MEVHGITESTKGLAVRDRSALSGDVEQQLKPLCNPFPSIHYHFHFIAELKLS
jgi:hypothetical protein